MMVLISAGNLIALYLGLELMSLALYVIAAFHREDAKASEAGLKYSCSARSRPACCSTARR